MHGVMSKRGYYSVYMHACSFYVYCNVNNKTLHESEISGKCPWCCGPLRGLFSARSRGTGALDIMLVLWAWEALCVQVWIELQVQHPHACSRVPHHDVNRLLQQTLNPDHGKDSLTIVEKSSRPQFPPILQKILNSSPFLVRLLEDTAALQASANCVGMSEITSPLHCLAEDMFPVLRAALVERCQASDAGGRAKQFTLRTCIPAWENLLNVMLLLKEHMYASNT